MRFWRNTECRQPGARSGSRLCRTARSATNGTRIATTGSGPPGLIRMSDTTVERRRVPAGLRVELRLRHGQPRADALQAPERRARVRRRHRPVVVGTRQQSRSGLGELRAAAMQQATVNLFADMGVQPVTLQSGLVVAGAVDRHAAADLDDRHAGQRRQLCPRTPPSR